MHYTPAAGVQTPEHSLFRQRFLHIKQLLFRFILIEMANSWSLVSKARMAIN